MNLWADPSFEQGLPGLTLGGNAEVTDQFGAHAGAKALYLPAIRSPFGPINVVSSGSRLLATTPGEAFPVATWIDLANRGDALAECRYNLGDGSGVQILANSNSLAGSGWVLWEPGQITPTTPATLLEWRSRIPIAEGGGQYVLDQVVAGTGESAMARQLAEFAVKSVLAEMQLSLNPEIAGIQLERGDAWTLEPVKSFFGFRRPADPDTVELQVYVLSTRLPRWSFDLSQTIEGQRGPLVSRAEVMCQLTWANRANPSLSVGQMIESGWRYVAALERVFQNQPTLRQGPKLTVNDLQLEYDLQDRAGVMVDPHSTGAVGVIAHLQLQENHVGEMTASGGVAPSAQLETV